MTTLPVPTSEAQYGYVVGRVIRAIADGVDADDKPDMQAATGTVTFTPKARLGRTSDYSAFVVREPIVCPLNVQGFLTSQIEQYVALTVGVYEVSFQLGAGAAISSFPVEVTAEHTQAAPLDLVTAAPYSPPAGAVVQTMLVPAGAAVGQVLSWTASGLGWADVAAATDGVSSVNGKTGAVTLDAADVSAEPAGVVAGHVGEADPHPQYVTAAELPDVSGFVLSSDARLSDARTPLDHTHAELHSHANQTALDAVSGTNTGDQDLSSYATTASLAKVATTGAYADLTGKPTMLVPAGAAVGQVLSWTAAGLGWVDVTAGPAGTAISADGLTITAAGRPDVPASLTPDAQSAVAAAPVGCAFVSTDGAGVAAWVWRRRPTGWVVIDGATGWRNITTLTAATKPNTWVYLHLDQLSVALLIATEEDLGRITFPAGVRVARHGEYVHLPAVNYANQGLYGRLDNQTSLVAPPGAARRYSGHWTWPRDPGVWPLSLPGTPL